MAVSAALLALTAAGCASADDSADGVGLATSDGATTARTLEPCALLSTTNIDRVMGWTLPAGSRATAAERDGWSICNWEDPAVGAVQVQVHDGDGRAIFDQRRHELDVSGSVSARDAAVTGADQAYDSADAGVVGLRIGQRFVQVTVIGPITGDHQHLELAGAVVGAVLR